MVGVAVGVGVPVAVAVGEGGANNDLATSQPLPEKESSTSADTIDRATALRILIIGERINWFVGSLVTMWEDSSTEAGERQSAHLDTLVHASTIGVHR
jgi:hypothetical protein